MKKVIAVALSFSLSWMSVPVAGAAVADPYAPLRVRMTEKAYTAEMAAGPVVISYTPGLSSTSVTTLPGNPAPHLMEGSSGATAISLSSGRFAVKYNVKTAGTKSGITVDFNDYSTVGQETGNLSGLGNLTVGLTGGAHTVNVRFEDAGGNTAGFQLTQVASSTQRYWVMDLGLIRSKVDLSRIRAINFYVEPGNTASSRTSGTFYLRLNGTDASAPALPQLDPACVLLTNQSTVTLSGTKEAYSAVYVKGKLVAAADASTTWTANVSLGSEGSNSIALFAKSALGVSTATQTIRVIRDTKAPTGSVKINNGASSTSSVNVTLNVAVTDAGSGVDSMRFSTDGGKTWTEWEAFAATKSLTLPLKIGTNEVVCQVRDRLGNTGTFKDKIVSNDVSALCAEFSANLAALLAHPDLSTNYNDAVFQARENFQWKISTYTSSQRSQLLAGLNERDRALAKMLFATTQVIAPAITDAQLTSYAKKTPPVTGFTSADFRNNVAILEGMDPQSVLAFAALLAVPHFKDPNPAATWASQSWMMAVMDARYNALAQRSAVAKVLAQEQIMSVPLRTRVYFTWSGAPDIWISLPPVAVTLGDVPALTRLQSSTFEVYRSGATRALAGATAPAAPALDPAMPTVFGQKIVTISGTKAAYSSVYVNGKLVAPADASLTWTATVTLSSEGNNTVTLLAKSILGVACAPQKIILRRDTKAPTGSIKINNGALSTGTAAVTLNLTASDATSGVDAMRFSVDGGETWTDWEPFAVTRAITLSAGHGRKEVQCQIRDKVGNFTTLKDTINCEFLPATPVVTSTVPAYTNATQLVLSGTKEAQTYLYIDGTKTTADFNATSWTATVSLSADGSKTFSVTVKTDNGNTSAAATVSTIRDRAAPTGSVKINNGAASTGTRDVTLNLTAADALSGVERVRFTVDGGSTWTNWEVFAATRAITLTSGYGTKEVQYQVCDKAGNIATFTDTIVYEFTPTTPAVTSTVPVYTNGSSLTISGTKDAETYLYINGVQHAADFHATTWSATVSLTSDGSKTFSITARMATGKESPAATVRTTRDTVLPTGSVRINNGDATTDSNEVTLNLTASDALSGVDKIRFSTDGGSSWTDWEAFASTRAITLPGTDGTKEVRYQIRDKAGNISAVYADTITLQLPLSPVPQGASVVTVVDGDRRLFVRERLEDGSLGAEEAYISQGVNWAPVSLSPLNQLAEYVKWYKTDFALMAQMGINTIRVNQDFGTGADAIKILDELWRQGIKVIVRVDFPVGGSQGDLANVSAVVNAYKHHPAVLMWSVGSLWDINRYGNKFSTIGDAAAFTEQAAQLIKSLDSFHPVTTEIGDPHELGSHVLSAEAFPYLMEPYCTNNWYCVSVSTEDMVNTLVSSVDVWGITPNRGDTFQDALDQWRSITDKPAYIAQWGVGTRGLVYVDEDNKSQVNGQMWDEVYFELSAERTNGTLVGAFAHTWNNNTDVAGVGLVDINRNPSPAYTALQSRFKDPVNGVQMNANPVITVTSRGNESVEINGKVMFKRGGGGKGARGINVFVFDMATGIRITEYRSFDTFADDIWHTKLVDYLNSLADGTLVLFSITDEGGLRSYGAALQTKALLSSAAWGSTEINNVTWQGGWVMASIKGQGKLAEGVSRQVPVSITLQPSLALDINAGRRDTVFPSTPAVISPVPQFTNQTTLVLSGTKDAGTSILINGKLVVSLDNETTWTATVTLGAEGDNALNVTSLNALGKSSATLSLSVKRDTVAPTGSVVINNGDATTGSTTVTLSLTGSDTTSGVDAMRFSVDGGTTWTAWETFATTKSVTLTPGYGTKTVQYQLKDKAANIATCSDTIEYEALPITPVVTSNVPGVTNQTTVTLSGTKGTQTSVLINGVVVVALDSATTWTATVNLGAEGTNTLTITSRNGSGKTSGSSVLTVVRDTVVPAGTININSGTAYTTSRTVTLNLSATDTTSGIDKMSFSHDNSTWTTPEAYAATKPSYPLPAGDGAKTVYVKYYDKAGNVSAVYSKTIVLDTVKPTGSIKINNGDATTTSRDVTLNLTAADSTSGVDTVRFSTDDGANWTSWVAYESTKALTLPGEAGTKKVSYQIMDKAGNISTVYSDTISYELGVPAQPSVVTVQAGDRRLFVQDRLQDGSLAPTVAYVAKGVNWSPTSYNTNPSADPLAFQKGFQTWYQTDIPMMAQMGINTVRVYHDFGTDANAIKVLDMLYQYGIKVIMTVDSPKSTVVADIANISTVVNAYKNHPAILMWSVGNEWDLRQSNGKYYWTYDTLEQAAAFVEQAALLIKGLDANHPVTTVVADSSAAKTAASVLVPSVDIWGINIYREQSFGEAISQWESVSGKPFYIGEFGADSYDHRIGSENQSMQAQMDGQLWDEVYFDLSAERTDGALVGALAFEWNDEWWKSNVDGAHTVSYESNVGQPDGHNDEEWFGIVDVYRNVKQAYTTMQGRFLNPEANVQTNATPLITVTSQQDTWNGSVRVELENKTLAYRGGSGAGGYTGITVAVIDGNTGIRLGDVRTFNTHATSNYGAGTYANTTAMINYINSLPNGTVVAIAIADEGGFTDVNGNPWSHPAVTQAYQLFESLGSTKVRQVKYWYGWAMIAVKGRPGPALAEDISVPSGRNKLTPVTVSARLSLTLDPDAGRRTTSAAAALPMEPEAKSAVAPAVSAAAPVISVTAQSAGVSTVSVDGKTVLRKTPGQSARNAVSVVSFDPRLGSRSCNVRTFSAGTLANAGANALDSYLESFADGTVYAVSVVDNPASGSGSAPGQSPRATKSVQRVLRSFGSTQFGNVKEHGNWAMIAIKGRGVLAESYADPSKPVTIHSRLPVSMIQDAFRE